jgi:hypothetical protein
VSRNPFHDDSEELRLLEQAAGEVAAQSLLRRHGMDRRLEPGDDEEGSAAKEEIRGWPAQGRP